MQRHTTSTHPHSADLDAREQASDAARAWLHQRVRWEQRLGELRGTRPRSGVLDRPGRSAGVRA